MDVDVFGEGGHVNTPFSQWKQTLCPTCPRPIWTQLFLKIFFYYNTYHVLCSMQVYIHISSTLRISSRSLWFPGTLTPSVDLMMANISPVLSNTKLSCMIPNSSYTQLLNLSCSTATTKIIRIRIKIVCPKVNEGGTGSIGGRWYIHAEKGFKSIVLPFVMTW